MSGVSFNHRTIKIAEWERNKKQVIALPTFRNFFLIKSGERNQKRERQREKVWWRISKGQIAICITFVSYFIGNLEKKVPTFRISSEIQKTIEISCFIKFLFIINIFYDIKNLFFFFSLNWFFSIPFKISPKDFPLFSFKKKKDGSCSFWVDGLACNITTPKNVRSVLFHESQDAILLFSVIFFKQKKLLPTDFWLKDDV